MILRRRVLRTGVSRVGGRCAILRRMCLMEFNRMTLPDFQVEHLDDDGEGHGEIDVSFRNVHIKAVTDKHDADEKQKT